MIYIVMRKIDSNRYALPQTLQVHEDPVHQYELCAPLSACVEVCLCRPDSSIVFTLVFLVNQMQSFDRLVFKEVVGQCHFPYPVTKPWSVLQDVLEALECAGCVIPAVCMCKTLICETVESDSI
jgi:hypothetical protein